MVKISIDVPEAKMAEVIDYLNKVEDVNVQVQEESKASKPDRVQRQWYGILENSPNKEEMIKYFDNVRDEWEDRL